MELQQDVWASRARTPTWDILRDIAARISQVNNDFAELMRRYRAKDKPISTQFNLYISNLAALWELVYPQLKKDETVHKIDKWISFFIFDRYKAEIYIKIVKELHRSVMQVLKRDGIYDLTKKFLKPEEFWRGGL